MQSYEDNFKAVCEGFQKEDLDIKKSEDKRFLELKKKIISHDFLLKKISNQSKEIENIKKSNGQLERECSKYEKDLSSALQELEPLKNSLCLANKRSDDLRSENQTFQDRLASCEKLTDQQKIFIKELETQVKAKKDVDKLEKQLLKKDKELEKFKEEKGKLLKQLSGKKPCWKVRKEAKKPNNNGKEDSFEMDGQALESLLIGEPISTNVEMVCKDFPKKGDTADNEMDANKICKNDALPSIQNHKKAITSVTATQKIVVPKSQKIFRTKKVASADIRLAQEENVEHEVEILLQRLCLQIEREQSGSLLDEQTSVVVSHEKIDLRRDFCITSVRTANAEDMHSREEESADTHRENVVEMDDGLSAELECMEIANDVAEIVAFAPMSVCKQIEMQTKEKTTDFVEGCLNVDQNASEAISTMQQCVETEHHIQQFTDEPQKEGILTSNADEDASETGDGRNVIRRSTVTFESQNGGSDAVLNDGKFPYCKKVGIPFSLRPILTKKGAVMDETDQVLRRDKKHSKTRKMHKRDTKKIKRIMKKMLNDPPVLETSLSDYSGDDRTGNQNMEEGTLIQELFGSDVSDSERQCNKVLQHQGSQGFDPLNSLQESDNHSFTKTAPRNAVGCFDGTSNQLQSSSDGKNYLTIRQRAECLSADFCHTPETGRFKISVRLPNPAGACERLHFEVDTQRGLFDMEYEPQNVGSGNSVSKLTHANTEPAPDVTLSSISCKKPAKITRQQLADYFVNRDMQTDNHACRSSTGEMQRIAKNKRLAPDPENNLSNKRFRKVTAKLAETKKTKLIEMLPLKERVVIAPIAAPIQPASCSPNINKCRQSFTSDLENFDTLTENPLGTEVPMEETVMHSSPMPSATESIKEQNIEKEATKTKYSERIENVNDVPKKRIAKKRKATSLETLKEKEEIRIVSDPVHDLKAFWKLGNKRLEVNKTIVKCLRQMESLNSVSNKKQMAQDICKVLLNPTVSPTEELIIETVLMYLIKSKKNVFICAEGKNSPLLSPFENTLLGFLFYLHGSKKCHLARFLPQFKRTLISMLFSGKHHTLFGAACLVRVYTAICRRQGQLPACRILCFDLAMEMPETALFLIASVAAIWPQVFHEGECRPLVKVFSYWLMKYNFNNQTLESQCKSVLERFCSFKCDPSVDLGRLTSEILHHFRNSEGASAVTYECRKALELLYKHEEWNLTTCSLIEQQLLPLLESYLIDCIKISLAKSIIGLLGLLCPPWPKSDSVVRLFTRELLERNEVCDDVQEMMVLTLVKVKDPHMHTTISRWAELHPNRAASLLERIPFIQKILGPTQDR